MDDRDYERSRPSCFDSGAHFCCLDLPQTTQIKQAKRNGRGEKRNRRLGTARVVINLCANQHAFTSSSFRILLT